MSDQKQQGKGRAADGRRTLREEAPEKVGDVLGLLAHDLRNPLAALSSNVGFLEMMKSELTEDVAEAVTDLQLSIEALGRIIDSLELVSHDLGKGKVPAAMQVRAGSLLAHLRPQAERAADSHGVTLEVQSGPADEEQVFVSEVYFQRALTALVHNAITAAPTRSIVRLEVEREGGALLFRVLDDGAALSPELAEAALTAAGQCEVKTARSGRYSRGLGLYAVARCAELAGAKLRIGETESGSSLELSCPLSK